MKFGENIRALRIKLNISREELANHLNISYGALSKYETNERFPRDESFLNELADFFNVSTDYLLGHSAKFDSKKINQRALGPNIKKWRMKNNLTQKELGSILNISARSIGFYESGERDPDTKTLVLLSNYFKVSLDDLFIISESIPTSKQYSTSSFGNILKTERTKNNLSQVELGKLLNLSKQTISGYENNSSFPSQETLLKLSDIFDVSIDYLLGKSDERIINNNPVEIIAQTLHFSEDVSELSPEEIEQIDDYIRFIKSKHKK